MDEQKFPTASVRRTWTAASWIFLVVLTAVGWGTMAQAIERNAIMRAGSAIQVNDLQRHVDVLADDTFEGREAGTRGGRAAGSYLVRFFRSGLQPAGSEGYFQPFGRGYRNILGVLPGSHPQRKHEYILIGAHYDHVGYGSRENSYGPLGYIHNGADDNASGVAAVLEILDALGQLPTAPQRSLVLALWDGEEKGLLGSSHWTAQPTLPLKQVKLAINLDMVGRMRDNRVELMGTRSMPGLRQLISRANRSDFLRLDFQWDHKPNSDHHTFFSEGIPSMMLHTGLHDDYHRPSDDAHRVNVSGIQAVARLALAVMLDAADAPQLAPFRQASRTENDALRRAYEAPLTPPPPRLGVSWDLDDGGPGIRLTRIMPGSAAQQAGLQVGDRILQFNQQEVHLDEITAFQQQVLLAAGSVPVVIRRGTDPEPITRQIELPGSPVRLGISWRYSDAEPRAVTLARIVPGSPAANAGLHVGDRIYEIAGQAFASSDEFRALAKAAISPLPLLVEREGQMRNVVLHLPEAEEDAVP